MGNLSSLDMERDLLGALINKPEALAEIQGFLTERDFTLNEHGVIFNTIKQIFANGKQFNKSLLIHEVKSLGIQFKGVLDIGEYIDAISFVKMNEKAISDNSKEIIKLRVMRDMESTAQEIIKTLYTSKSKPLSQIVGELDHIYGSTLKTLEMDESPEKLMEGLKDILLEIASRPADAIGLQTPFEEFNKLYGGLRDCQVYAVASRPGQGKTTFLNYMGYKIAEREKVPVLFLDTEMMTNEIRMRLAASLSDISLFDIETGKWNTDEAKKGKMHKFLDEFKELDVYHIHVGNKTVDEVIAIARRWHWKHVGRGNKCLIVYDYLKLTGEKLSNNWAEHQAIGEKTDKLKKLCEELHCPLFTAIQINRSGENTNRNSSNVTDDSSVISQSDKVLWFVSYMGIFRRKTADEIQRDGVEFGTHKLIDLKARYQGESSQGHNDLVERKKEDGSSEFIHNYVNFNVANFRVSSCGTLHTIINQLELQANQASLGAAEDDDEQPL